MSVSIRISDDTAEELKSVQPDGMSLSKMCDTLLKLTLRKIKTDKENDDSTESFMEMVKKISDNISTDKFSDQTENEEEIIEQDEDNLSQEARKNLREEIENLKEEVPQIMAAVSDDTQLHTLWKFYQKKYPYAADISYEDIMESTMLLWNKIQ